MSVRPATLDDMVALLDLAEAMHAEAPQYLGWKFDPEKVERMFRGLIVGNGCLLVSEIDGVVVGGIAGICVEHWFSPEKVATDLALFILRERRNGTTAMRLIAGFVEWAKVVGARRVNLGITTGVHPDSTARLYAAAGLQSSGSIYSRDF